jgi:long-chain acyl-CoA synthetase
VSAHVAELLARAAEESPDRTALVEPHSGRRLTWRELDDEVTRVARGLNAAGFVAGYRVLLSLTNRVEFVTCYLGALRAGLVAVPVNPRSKTGELARMVADSGARVLVADPSTVGVARQAVAGLQDALSGADAALRARTPVPLLVVVDAPALPGETKLGDLLARAGTDAPPPADPEALAVLLYTSGTSGRPRAAMLTHRALLANIEQVAAVQPPMLTGDDVVLGVLPLFHVFGLNAVLGQVLRQRARLVVAEGFDAEGSLDLIEDEAVSVVPAAPPVFARWRSVEDLAERLSGVRLVLSGSAPLPAATVEEFTARATTPLHQGYGLTETAPVVTSTLCSRAAKPGSVGAALPGVSVKLIDEDGQPAEGEDPGEVYVCGDNLFSGYWPDGADGPREDGWWATGDVGILDADGDLFLVDRVKELVIVSGFNVYPVEVEEVVREVDGVAEAAVIGAPDADTGERVLAYIRPAAGHPAPAEELIEQVRAHCALRLARSKQPAEVHLVDELAHTVTGKVAKGRLRAARRRAETGLLE